MVLKKEKNYTQLQKEILDSYDFLPYLERYIYTSLSVIWYKFQEDHDKDKNLPAECEGYVCNFLTFEEFKDYLENRYPDFMFEEETDYLITRWSK